MGSGETNISALECNEENYYASIESSPESHNAPPASSVALRASGNSAQFALGLPAQVSLLAPLSLRGGEGELVCETPLALSGAECTPDTYVDAGDFVPIPPPKKTQDQYVAPKDNVPTIELSDLGPLAIPIVAVAAVTGFFGASCTPSSGGGGNGDGGFRFGDDDGGGDDMTMPVDDPDDVDGDGYPEDKDCDDTDATVHPRATETPYDGIDQDCNGEDVIDADGDGFVATQVGGDDCNDDQADIHPGAEQRLIDVDYNCDGTLEIDLERDAVKFVGENDGDQFGSSMALGDVNGDGYGDVIVGTGYAADGNGKAYIFFGGAGALLPGTTLYAADADVTITGGCIWLMAGVGASILAKDLNGDGAAEILIGTPGLNSSDCEEPGGTDESRSGGILVMEGRSDWDSVYDFSEIDITDAAALAENQVGLIKGANGGRIGRNILVTGDIDGDGVGQIVAGRQSSCDVIPARVYEGINRIDEVRDSEGGYRIYNNTGTPFAGNFCDNLASGDLNGDELADLVLGNTADEMNDADGKVVALLGNESFPSDINLSTLGAYSGLKHLIFSGNGEAHTGGLAPTAGGALAVGDLDADGKDELMIGVSGEDIPEEDSGRVYCIPGASMTEVIEGENSMFENGDTVVLNGDVISLGGLSFSAPTGRANLPTTLAVARTTDDPADSLLIGVVSYAGLGGRTFYFGSSMFDGGPPSSDVSVAEATAEMGLPVGNSFGARLVGDGDANADGIGDVLIAAPTGPEGTNRGNAYLLFGGAR